MNKMEKKKDELQDEMEKTVKKLKFLHKITPYNLILLSIKFKKKCQGHAKYVCANKTLKKIH